VRRVRRSPHPRPFEVMRPDGTRTPARAPHIRGGPAAHPGRRRHISSTGCGTSDGVCAQRVVQVPGRRPSCRGRVRDAARVAVPGCAAAPELPCPDARGRLSCHGRRRGGARVAVPECAAAPGLPCPSARRPGLPWPEGRSTRRRLGGPVRSRTRARAGTPGAASHRPSTGCAGELAGVGAGRSGCGATVRVRATSGRQVVSRGWRGCSRGGRARPEGRRRWRRTAPPPGRPPRCPAAARSR
jgi:hypothetical protein